MAYRVVFKPSAAKDLRRLPAEVLARIDKHLLALGSDPRPASAVKLAGIEDLYRIRLGDYRVVYRVEDDRLIVLVVRIGHRSDVYRRGLG